MTVTNVVKDPEALTMTITCEFDAPVERVWQLWDDPRQLERWWGPPGYPATFVDHELREGADVSYFMTGPDGDKGHAWWRIVAVAPPHSLEFDDGFSDSSGAPNTEMPTVRVRVALGERAGGTRMTVETTFDSVESMERLLEMGMDEGMRLAAGQMDDILRAA